MMVGVPRVESFISPLIILVVLRCRMGPGSVQADLCAYRQFYNPFQSIQKSEMAETNDMTTIADFEQRL